MKTIDHLLKALSNPDKSKKKSLINNKETWIRIANRDKFSELGLDRSALDLFLTEWVELNPYSNIQ